MPISTFVIALGSNRRHHLHGPPDQVVTAAAGELARLGKIAAVSRIIRSPALGPAGRSFANAALLLQTELSPPALLARLKQIERAFGRRGGRRWGARVLDLDIILWSGGPFSGDRLTIPHPEFRKRNFVLDPLAEIVPGWRDPLTGRTIRQLRSAVDRRSPRA